MGLPFALLSTGAMAPSIEQYAGTFPDGTHRGADNVTAATGSAMEFAGIVDPNFSTVQSASVMTFGSLAGA